MNESHIEEAAGKVDMARQVAARIREVSAYLQQVIRDPLATVSIVVNVPGRGEISISTAERDDYQHNICNHSRSTLATMAKIVGEEALSRLRERLNNITLPV